MKRDVWNVVEWWAENGSHGLLKSDGRIFERRGRTWVEVGKLLSPNSVAVFAHGILTNPHYRVRRLAPQVNVFPVEPEKGDG